MQYIAVASGYGVDPAFQQLLMSRLGRLECGRAAGRGRLGVRSSSERRRADVFVGRVWASRQKWRLALAHMTLSLIFRNPFMLRARTTTIAASRALALIAAILMALGSSRRREGRRRGTDRLYRRSERCHRQGRRSRGHARDPQGSRRLPNSRALQQPGDRAVFVSTTASSSSARWCRLTLEEGALVFEVGSAGHQARKASDQRDFSRRLHP